MSGGALTRGGNRPGGAESCHFVHGEVRARSAGSRLDRCTSACTLMVMAKRYSIAEARANLPAVVDEAAAGGGVELTRRGKPVAVMLSIEEAAELRGRREGFAAAYARFARKYDVREVGLDRKTRSRLRDHGTGRKVAL